MAGLGAYPMAAVLRAEDLDRAVKFYKEVLGLADGVGSGPGSAMLEAGAGSMVMIYERPGMEAPSNTTLTFGIPADQFDSLAEELKGKGIVFEDYNMPEIGIETTNGVAEMDGNKAAWFKDTEGNIVTIRERNR